MASSRRFCGNSSGTDCCSFGNFGSVAILIGTLSAVVLGGRRTVIGPLVGTTILVLLPEIFRPLADYRQAIYGLLLVVVMAFLPFGVYDTIIMKLHNRRLARAGMLLPPKAAS